MVNAAICFPSLEANRIFCISHMAEKKRLSACILLSGVELDCSGKRTQVSTAEFLPNASETKSGFFANLEENQHATEG